MSSKKVIAVLGATGTQGGGVVRDLLADGEFAVRAVTRNPDSDSSKELKKQGVEVVKGDLTDVPSLVEAFKGAYGVFGVTDFWSLFFKNNFAQQQTEDEEVQLGKNLVDAAKAAGVQHFIWSTLEDTEKIHCYHWAGKEKIGKYLKESGLPFTEIYTAFYYNNVPQFKSLTAKDDGTFEISFPIPKDVKFHVFDGSDLGRWVIPALKNRDKYLGKSLHAVAEFISPSEWAEIIQKVSGKKVVAAPEVTREEFYTKEFREKTGDEMWLNWQLWVENAVTRDFELSKSVAPDPITLEKFIQKDPGFRKILGLN